MLEWVFKVYSRFSDYLELNTGMNDTGPVDTRPFFGTRR